jgi:hypothetical protein
MATGLGVVIGLWWPGFVNIFSFPINYDQLTKLAALTLDQTS